jgi:hypothetical protein
VQFTLVIFMVSTSGKIPTGSTTIDLATLKLGEGTTETVNIEKCPDKSANLTYTASLLTPESTTPEEEAVNPNASTKFEVSAVKQSSSGSPREANNSPGSFHVSNNKQSIPSRLTG